MTRRQYLRYGVDIRSLAVVAVALVVTMLGLAILDERPVRSAGLTLLGNHLQPRWYPSRGAGKECLVDVVYLDNGEPVSLDWRLKERNRVGESDFSDLPMDDPIPFDVPIATSYADSLSGFHHRHSSIALFGTIDRQTGRCFVSVRRSLSHPYTTYRFEALPGRLMRLVVSEECFGGDFRECGFLLELSKEGEIVLNSQIVPPSDQASNRERTRGGDGGICS